MGCAVCVDTATGDTLTWGCEKVWVTGFSRESTRTCQSGRARWVTLLPDSLAGILSAKAGAFPSPNTPALNEATTSPSPGLGPASLIGQCQAGAAPPQLSSLPPRGADTGGRPRGKATSCPQAPGFSTSECRAGLTSWRMSSSLGMMESSRVSSLQRQGRGSGPAEATGSGRTGILVSRAPPGPRGWVHRDSVTGQELLWEREAGGAHLFWIRAMTWE